jgi:hypothetical protein
LPNQEVLLVSISPAAEGQIPQWQANPLSREQQALQLKVCHDPFTFLLKFEYTLQPQLKVCLP